MVSSIDIVVDCIVSLLLKLNVFFVFVTMSSYDESDEDYSSSDFCIPIQTNHSNSNPPQTVNHITESEFQTVVQNINSTKSYINISADNIDSVVSEKDMLFVNISEITISPEVSNINILPDVEEVVEPDVEAVIEPDVEVVIP